MNSTGHATKKMLHCSGTLHLSAAISAVHLLMWHRGVAGVTPLLCSIRVTCITVVVEGCKSTRKTLHKNDVCKSKEHKRSNAGKSSAKTIYAVYCVSVTGCTRHCREAPPKQTLIDLKYATPLLQGLRNMKSNGAWRPRQEADP